MSNVAPVPTATDEDASPSVDHSMRLAVAEAVEAIRPVIQMDGGDIRLVDVVEATGVVTVELSGACVGCPSSTMTLKAGVERILCDRVPGVTEVNALGLDAEDVDDAVSSAESVFGLTLFGIEAPSATVAVVIVGFIVAFFLLNRSSGGMTEGASRGRGRMERCRRCGERFQPERIELLGNGDTRMHIDDTCPKCGWDLDWAGGRPGGSGGRW